MRSFIFIAAAIVCFIEVASALQCYNCTSHVKGCGSTFELSEEDQKKYLINCDVHYKKPTACRKFVTKQLLDPLVVRDCHNDTSLDGYKPVHCYDLNEMTTCYCAGDKCNGQGQITPVLFLTLSAALITFVIKAFRL